MLGLVTEPDLWLWGHWQQSSAGPEYKGDCGGRYLGTDIWLTRQLKLTVIYLRNDYYWLTGNKASVCVCLNEWLNQNGWNYSHQTCQRDSLSRVLATHLILGQRSQGHKVQNTF